MKLKLSSLNNKVYIQYLAKYLLIVFVFCSLALFFTYAFIIHRYRDDLLASNFEKFNNSRKVIDNEIQRMHQIAAQINENIVLSPSALNSSYAYLTAVNELRKYKVASSYLDDIFLFYNDQRMQHVIATFSTYPKEEFYSGYRLKIPAPTEWSDSTPRLFFSNGITAQGEPMEVFVYVYPLTISSKPRDGTLLFIINVQAVLNVMMSNFDNVNKSAGIMDANGSTIVFKSNYDAKINEEDVREALKSSPETENIFSTTIKNEKFTMIRLPSEKHNWTYFTVLKQEQLEASMLNLRKVISIGMIILLLLSIPSSWILARSDYKPIHNLVEAIKKPEQEVRVTESGNELAFIQRAFEYYVTEKKKLQFSLKAQEKMLEDNIVISLLRGNTDVKEARYQMDVLGTLLDGEYFLLGLVLIDDYEGFKSRLDTKAQAQVKHEIVIQIKKFLGAAAKLHCSEDVAGNRFIVLLNYDASLSKEEMIGISCKLMSYCHTALDLSISVVIGDPFNNMEDVKQQMAKVYELAKCRLTMGWNSLIESGRIKEAGYFTNLLPEDNLYLLYKQGNLNSILQHLNTALEMWGNGLFSPDTCRIEFYKVLRIMNRVSEETALPQGKCYGMIREALRIEVETIQQMHAVLADISTALCNAVLMQKESHNSLLRDKITTFLKSNYTDSRLTLEMIAEEYHMSPQYISRYFKDQTGESISSYLEKLRMTAAKQLLEDTNMTVKEIVMRVGYGDVNHFIRKFRTVFGMTPINYRKIFIDRIQ